MDESAGESFDLEALNRRVGILSRLRDGPTHKRDLADELDQSRRTINRAINELQESDLVERGEGGFVATTAGRLAVDELRTFRSRLDDVVDAEAVLAPVPADAPIDADAVAGGEALLASEPVPHRPLERFHDALDEATRYRALLTALDDPRQIRLLYEHVVTAGRPAELVVSPALLEALRTEFPRRLTAMAEADEFDLLVGEVPPFAVGIVERGPQADPETVVFVVVFTESGGGVCGVLVNGSESARRWAVELYGRVTGDAEAAADALSPEPDGGARATDSDLGTRLARAVEGDSLPVPLKRQGFVRLDGSYFRGEPVADPTTAWRAGLTLPEVHTGYAVARSLEPEDGGSDRREMSAAITDALEAETDCAVVGPPGSGKSTVCKRVACDWYAADRGPVLYREGGRGRPFASVTDLVALVEAADGHALVVVEDAVRTEADAVFEAIDRLADRANVSFLLDSRESEWRDPPGDPRRGTDLSAVHMPRLSETDATRLVEHFERTVGEPVDVPVDRLREEVASDDEGAPNEVLLLLHRLATYADPLAGGRTSLEAAVAGVYEDLDDLARSVCTLANALNAAGIDVEAGALYAVAHPDEFDAVDAAIDQLEGRVLFHREDGTYRTVHESWSVAFLAHLIEVEGAEAAALRFGDAVSALLALADDSGRRQAITRHLDEGRPLAALTDASGRWADETVESVHALGRERPKLAPLFGDGKRDSVAMPEACSTQVREEQPVRLGRSFLEGGFYDRAERAFERLPQEVLDAAVERLLGLSRVAAERGDYDEAVASAERCLDLIGDADSPRARARARLELGEALRNLRDYESAGTHLRSALEDFEALQDSRRTARTLNRLGLVSLGQGDYDRARGFFDRSLARSRGLSDRHGESNSLHNIGWLAYKQGEYEVARKFYQRSLELDRVLGDRSGVATSLNNLAEVAHGRGDHERAHEYFQRRVDLDRDIGNRNGVAMGLNNLGVVAKDRCDYEQAREYLERSLDIKRDLGERQGEAICIENLGDIARVEADYDRARERYERSLDTYEDIGDRAGVARMHNDLGALAMLQGEYGPARERFEVALETSREIDARRTEAETLGNVGAVATLLGDHERAEDRLERALEVATEVGDPGLMSEIGSRLGDVTRAQEEYDRARDHLQQAAAEDGNIAFETARIRLVQGSVALDCGEPKSARERATAARETFAGLDATHLEARSRRLLGRVAAETGDPTAAREHWRAALESFDTVGASQDALATLHHLVATCRDEGDDEAARQWIRRARETLSDAPEAVVERYGELSDGPVADTDGN
jgi:tetratricopeptide (TPR) repeat protein/predicted transcriptional regulator